MQEDFPPFKRDHINIRETLIFSRPAIAFMRSRSKDNFIWPVLYNANYQMHPSKRPLGAPGSCLAFKTGEAGNFFL